MNKLWRGMGLHLDRPQGPSRAQPDSSDEDEDEESEDEHLVWPGHCDPLLRVEGQGLPNSRWGAYHPCRESVTAKGNKCNVNRSMIYIQPGCWCAAEAAMRTI
jgi:hypothetical protein